MLILALLTHPINADIFERVSNLSERVESKKFPKCLI